MSEIIEITGEDIETIEITEDDISSPEPFFESNALENAPQVTLNASIKKEKENLLEVPTLQGSLYLTGSQSSTMSSYDSTCPSPTPSTIEEARLIELKLLEVPTLQNTFNLIGSQSSSFTMSSYDSTCSSPTLSTIAEARRIEFNINNLTFLSCINDDMRPANPEEQHVVPNNFPGESLSRTLTQTGVNENGVLSRSFGEDGSIFSQSSVISNADEVQSAFLLSHAPVPSILISESDDFHDITLDPGQPNDTGFADSLASLNISANEGNSEDKSEHSDSGKDQPGECLEETASWKGGNNNQTHFNGTASQSAGLFSQDPDIPNVNQFPSNQNAQYLNTSQEYQASPVAQSESVNNEIHNSQHSNDNISSPEPFFESNALKNASQVEKNSHEAMEKEKENLLEVTTLQGSLNLTGSQSSTVTMSSYDSTCSSPTFSTIEEARRIELKLLEVPTLENSLNLTGSQSSTVTMSSYDSTCSSPTLSTIAEARRIEFNINNLTFVSCINDDLTPANSEEQHVPNNCPEESLNRTLTQTGVNENGVLSRSFGEDSIFSQSSVISNSDEVQSALLFSYAPVPSILIADLAISESDDSQDISLGPNQPNETVFANSLPSLNISAYERNSEHKSQHSDFGKDQPGECLEETASPKGEDNNQTNSNGTASQFAGLFSQDPDIPNINQFPSNQNAQYLNNSQQYQAFPATQSESVNNEIHNSQHSYNSDQEFHDMGLQQEANLAASSSEVRRSESRDSGISDQSSDFSDLNDVKSVILLPHGEVKKSNESLSTGKPHIMDISPVPLITSPMNCNNGNKEVFNDNTNSMSQGVTKTIQSYHSPLIAKSNFDTMRTKRNCSTPSKKNCKERRGKITKKHRVRASNSGVNSFLKQEEKNLNKYIRNYFHNLDGILKTINSVNNVFNNAFKKSFTPFEKRLKNRPQKRVRNQNVATSPPKRKKISKIAKEGDWIVENIGE